MTNSGLDHRYMVRNFVLPFDPANVAGLVARYDASNAASIASSGGLVSQWNDLSGNGNHMVQPGAAQPTTGGATLNGLNVLSFSGTKVLTATVTTLAQPITMFFVSQATSGSDNRIFDTTGRTLYGQKENSASAGNRIFFAGSSVITLGAGTNNVELTSLVFNGASSQGWVNSSSVGTGNPGTTATGTTWYLGNGSDGDSFAGIIAEVIIYGAALSTADRGSVEGYLKAKWGTP